MRNTKTDSSDKVDTMVSSFQSKPVKKSAVVNKRKSSFGMYQKSYGEEIDVDEDISLKLRPTKTTGDIMTLVPSM